jgi:anti-sigma regulatory factor (Ser/Thr protein kinase)
MSPVVLHNIDTSFSSYQQIINLYNDNKDSFLADIELSFQKWFSANMSSALGAVLDKLIDDFNNIKISNIPGNIKTILQKNNFLSHYGYSSVYDSNNTTIKFLKLNPADSRFFNEYVRDELLGRSEMPSMSSALTKKIAESIYEIFVNARIHSESASIYTCGQFFPSKHKIEFTITDTGIGFRNRINKTFNSNLSAVQTIKWAINDGHSTKQGIPGGIGLAILKEFTVKNCGKIQIVSNDGFYQLDAEGEHTAMFAGEFPGTIVNMQFRTDDRNSYILKSEVHSGDLF